MTPPRRIKSSTSGLTIETRQVGPTDAYKYLLTETIEPATARRLIDAEADAETLMTELNRSYEHSGVNRRLAPAAWLRYARDMSNGDWLSDGAAIRFDQNGRLVDGQHRMLAIIESGTTHEFVIIGNVPPEAQLVMDSGRARRVGDQLAILGITQSNLVGAVTKLLILWRSGNILSKTLVTTSEITKMLQVVPQITDGVKEATRVRTLLPQVNKSALGAFWVETNAVDAEACELFFDGLRTGVDLIDGDPILALRRSIISNRAGAANENRRIRRYNQSERLFQMVTAWNHWLRWSDENDPRSESFRMSPSTTIRVPTNLTSENFPTVDAPKTSYEEDEQ
jgi:hypothetical protein